MMNWAVHLVYVADTGNVYTILGGKLIGKMPCGRYMRIWDDNINMNLKEIGCEGVVWNQPGLDRDQGTQ
jgi:hypothetical protein